MALSGSQRTRIGGHGAGRAYLGFTAKTIALIKAIPRSIAVLARQAVVMVQNRVNNVSVASRTESVGAASSERSVVIKRGLDK